LGKRYLCFVQSEFDVMFVVFAHLAADRPDDSPGPRARTHSRTNFAFSHVCRHWRAAALAEPRLWTRIHALSPAPGCMPTMIARSQGLPLILCVQRRLARDIHFDPLCQHEMVQLHRLPTLRRVVDVKRTIERRQKQHDARCLSGSHRANIFEGGKTLLPKVKNPLMTSSARYDPTEPTLQQGMNICVILSHEDLLTERHSCAEEDEHNCKED
jgi:hypothetical protein